MFGVISDPPWVGWHYSPNRAYFGSAGWRAECSGDTRAAVARRLRALFGNDAAVQALPRGEIPSGAPIRDEDVSFVPSYGRNLKRA